MNIAQLSRLRIAQFVVAGAFDYTFTPAGASGQNGPTLAQCESAYSGEDFLVSDFAVSPQGFQQLTIQNAGTYTIEVHGAKAGSYLSGTDGGYGTKMIGEFTLAVNDVVTMVIGQQGVDATNPSSGGSGGGGGGGTYVSINGTIQIVAGGGGGAGGYNSITPGKDALTGTTGGSGYLTAGGIGGLGGGGDNDILTGNGGAGYNGDGIGSSYGNFGKKWNHASTKSKGGDGYNQSGDGGFGGGGGGSYGSGAGGGGFSGGGGGGYTTSTSHYAGGGGSYNNGSNQTNSVLTSGTDGKVVLTKI